MSETGAKVVRNKAESLEQVFADRGLTAWEQHVVTQRLAGLSTGEIGRSRGASRQAVHIAETRACRRLGIGSIAAVIYADNRLARMESTAAPIGDEAGKVDERRRNMSQSERLQCRLERLASDLLAETMKGALSDERRAYYQSEGSRLAEAIARLER